jgi:hypothetical protein
MEEDSQVGGVLKWGLGAVGLGAAAALITLPWRLGLLIAAAIVVLFVLLFGGFYLWRRRRAKRQREQFSSALQDQTSQAPKSISDPNQRANLDRVRQKFQAGLQEFKSRGKDIYKLPWYAIIGESGSGKTEAIRHSGIDFPPGLQDKLQGSGGTINMDWWFTNRGIILDTAGSMLFSETGSAEAPEWREFLRLLKKARPHCPINGLFLVLSVESLIKDSADKIAQKASRIAQQLDVIQRALDVRFPVYLFVTKCDLLTGFREFFDSIDDPLLQHQMFGWSNPDPLDSHFRPDLVEAHLKSVTARLCRRRMALYRDTQAAVRSGDTQLFYAANPGGSMPNRRLDELEAMFALPESVGRLAPRLRRYLETIFVAGEWSAKPVFLRGIYFTSSMREGKALDEAIALATGLPLDQLPDEKSWEKNRAFFLRDLFHEKVFRESGLVTRATNTLKLLRQRQFLIFGTAGAALLLLLVFSGFAYRNLKRSVLGEVDYWRAGATPADWTQGVWTPAIVTAGQSPNVYRFTLNDTNVVPVGGRPLPLPEFQRALKETAQKRFQVSFIFKPMAWLGFGKVSERGEAQRMMFEGSVLKPLVRQTRRKLENEMPSPSDPAAVGRHREALLALIRLEADGLAGSSKGGLLATTNAAGKAEMYLRAWTSYLTESTNAVNTNLVDVFAWTYSKGGSGEGKWPPPYLLGGDKLVSNSAIRIGLENFRKANQAAEGVITNEVSRANDLVAALESFRVAETLWLQGSSNWCQLLTDDPTKGNLDRSWAALGQGRGFGPLTNVGSRYLSLVDAATKTSAAAFGDVASGLPDEYKTKGIIAEISEQLRRFASEAGGMVISNYQARSNVLASLDRDYVAPWKGAPLYQYRWSLYSNACALASYQMAAQESDVGSNWVRFASLTSAAGGFETELREYTGPLAADVSRVGKAISADAIKKLREKYLQEYAVLVKTKLRQLAALSWTVETVTNAGGWLGRVETDLSSARSSGIPAAVTDDVTRAVQEARTGILGSIGAQLADRVGFPVRRGSSKVMDLAGALELRNLLRALTSELQRPAWNAADKAALESLRSASAKYAGVLNALLKENGEPAEWELRFVPSEQQADRDIIRVYRYANFSIANRPAEWEELTRAEAPLTLGKGVTDAGVKIRFKKLPGDTAGLPGLEANAWGLVELLKLPAPERLDEGTRWRIKLRLEAGQGIAPGNVNLEAVLKTALPKLEEWPE